MAPEQGRQETPPQKLSIIKISNFILFPFSSDVFRLKAGTVQQAIDSGYAMITTDIPANKFGKYGTVSAIEEVPSPRPDSKRKHIKITGKFRARITKTESPPAKEGEILPQFIFAEWKKLEDSPVGDEIWHSPDFQSKLNEFRNLVTANLTAIRTITMNNHDESLQALFQETLDIAANIGQNNFSESLDKISSVFNMSPNISLDASNFSYDYLRKLAETLAEIQPMARLEMLIELAQKDDNILKKILETKKVIDEGRGQTGLNHPLQQIYNEKKDKISEEARRVIEHGLEQLNNINPQSAEYEKLDTYLDWLVKYPWGETGKDNEDINKIARTLDEDHYGLPQPKLRIKEFIAAKSLNPELESPILLFVGPPGTGKTSLGKSIARALDRKFVRMSVGGIHDESEIRGFPKTYVGSKPGRFVREIRRAETLHLVFMIDEVDKLYGGGAQGSAQDSFLEVLDPEQYRNFVDNYMEVGIDLSPILFICTANVTDKIPPALLNRMEVIYFSSYSEDEKTHIARKFLIPKQLQKNGLTPDSKMFRQDNEARFEPVKIDISDSVISALINEYTDDGGARELERKIAAILRKVATKIKEQNSSRQPAEERYGLSPPTENIWEINEQNLPFYVDEKEKVIDKHDLQPNLPVGVVPMLAVSPYGSGQVLYVEAIYRKKDVDHRKIKITGVDPHNEALGKMIEEQADAAWDFLFKEGGEPGILSDLDMPGNHYLHVRFANGGLAKDGPSAGIPILWVLYSLYTNQPVKDGLAATGEVTMAIGKNFPVGAIKEKVLAAYNAGAKEVVIPKSCENDIDEIPDNVKQEVKIIPCQSMLETLKIAFPNCPRLHPPSWWTRFKEWLKNLFVPKKDNNLSIQPK